MATSDDSGLRTGPTPRRLGRYRLDRAIGSTTIGPVYLGRDRVSGRSVRVQVLRPDRAADPAFVARFFRRVLAASTIRADAIAPVLDFGEDRGAVFVALGSTPGRIVSALIRAEVPIDPESAASIVLQAARGLAIAREQGLTHGGLNPDSLWIGDDGRVRIVDLGQAIGPVDLDVQSDRDEAAGPRSEASEKRAIPVDRAEAARIDDVRSLGAILSALISGGDAPKTRELDEIARRLAGSGSGPPLADLPSAVLALETFLGLAPIPPLPTSDWVADLESALLEYESPPLARLGPRIVAGIVGGCIALGLLAALLRLPSIAWGFLGLALLSATARGLVSGIVRGSTTLDRLRGLAADRSPGEWASAVVGLGLIGLALVAIGLFKAVFALGAAALLIAIGLEFEIDRKLALARRSAIARARGLLNRWPGGAANESQLRRFVWKVAGDRSPSFYADLFGPESVREARRDWGGSRPRLDPKDPDSWISALGRTLSAFEGPILRWIDARIADRRADRGREVLRAAEEAGGVALGVNLLTARRRARRLAGALVAKAEVARSGHAVGVGAGSVLAAADDPERSLEDQEIGVPSRRWPAIAASFLGARARFLAGAVLLAGCLAWMIQNEVIPGAEARAVAAEAVRSGDLARAGEAAKARIGAIRGASRGYRPLRSSIFPPAITSFFRDFRPGLAGFVLIASSLVAGWRWGLPAVLLAILILFARPPAFLTIGAAQGRPPARQGFSRFGLTDPAGPDGPLAHPLLTS